MLRKNKDHFRAFMKNCFIKVFPEKNINTIKKVNQKVHFINRTNSIMHLWDTANHLNFSSQRQ